MNYGSALGLRRTQQIEITCENIKTANNTVRKIAHNVCTFLVYVTELRALLSLQQGYAISGCVPDIVIYCFDVFVRNLN